VGWRVLPAIWLFPPVQFHTLSRPSRTPFRINGSSSSSRGAAEQVQEDTGQVFKFKRLDVKTRPRVRVYADNYMVGRTPASVTAEVSAVRVLVPQ
jgi:hypothetical protein